MKVGKLNYKIELIENIGDKRLSPDGEENLGITQYKDERIYIYNGASYQTKRETLTHEIIHTFLEYYGLNKEKYTKEDVCNFFAKFGKEIVEKSEAEARKLWKR